MDYDGNIGRGGAPPRLVLRIAIPALGLAGMGISAYLVYIHYRWVEPVCLAGMDCNSVLFSPYAEIWGVPISLLGLVLYTLITCGGLLLRHPRKLASSLSALGIYTMALSGTLYSAFLTYREAFTLHAYCTWCVGSALVMTAILVLSFINLSAFGLRFNDILRVFTAKLTGRCLSEVEVTDKN